MKNIFYFYNGRSALNFILESLNLGIDHEILYPEFTCDVLFQYRKKYRYDFYKTNNDFSFNFNLIKKKITNNTKVVILINFFGIIQNTKKIYNFCKKKKIFLVIDDCHTFYNPKKKLSYDCDFKFFSPGKVIPELGFGGILIDYNNVIHKNENFRICKSQNTKLFLKRFVKSTILYKTFKSLKKRPKYENPNFFRSKYIVKRCYLNKKDQNIINNFDYIAQKKISHQNFKFWTRVSKELNVKPLINYKFIKHGIPLYYVAKCRNKLHAKKIFDFGWRHNIEITSWPTLNKKMKKKKDVINYWNKLVFFPNIYKINFDNKKISWKI
tara:strand:+ start:7288 stop:8262 length:975 start_codon:yes stop_codon:yes gene_type:complete